MSLALLPLSSANPVGWFCLRTLSFGRPTLCLEPILDSVVVSCVVIARMMCNQSGRHVNVGSLHHLLRLVRACCFASLVLTSWGYKNKWSPLHTLTSSRIINHSFLVFFIAPEKRERMRGEILGIREHCFPFPLEPWRNKTGSLPRSCRTTTRAS
jgi:hypothetical protein